MVDKLFKKVVRRSFLIRVEKSVNFAKDSQLIHVNRVKLCQMVLFIFLNESNVFKLPGISPEQI